MRMNEMNAYFESKGFTVKREYHSCDTDCNKGYYVFDISKNGHCVTGTYRWPDEQQSFMDRMIKSYENEYGDNRKIILSTHNPYRKDQFAAWASSLEFTKPGTLYADRILNDPIRQATENLVEKTIKEMLNVPNSFFPSILPKIKNVIFNDPATIVFWTDGSKTVVKCQDDDVFDPEKGLAMAISKKALGNKGNYCNELKKWLPKKYLCMYCGAETTNDSWDHMCDECKNEPLDPIPENLKKEVYCNIKIPDLSGLKQAAKAMDDLVKICKEKKKRSKIQKAYDILVAYRDGVISVEADQQTSPDRDVFIDLDEVIGYLGEALED